MTALATDLADALEEMVREFPAFRSKPEGAPNSAARQEQERQIAREDRALELIAKARAR